MAYSLRLIEDMLAPRAGHATALPPLNRVLYVARGTLVVKADAGPASLASDAAWHGVGACVAQAGDDGALVLRFELCPEPPASPGSGRVLLEHPVALDPRSRWLMRCDRVDFEPGGVALPHRHRGGGIRWLLRGVLDVTVGESPARRMAPGSAWFESGREPVRAVAAPEVATSFVRVAILPLEIQGQSSILYVDPADAARGKPRKYTVYVDAPIAIDTG